MNDPEKLQYSIPQSPEAPLQVGEFDLTQTVEQINTVAPQVEAQPLDVTAARENALNSYAEVQSFVAERQEEIGAHHIQWVIRAGNNLQTYRGHHTVNQ